MRSKCRCSCVLQFTFRRAVSCVLHRPPSQVIHCTVLCFKHCSASAPGIRINSFFQLTSHHWGGQQSNSSPPWREGAFPGEETYVVRPHQGTPTRATSEPERRESRLAGHGVRRVSRQTGQDPELQACKSKRRVPSSVQLFAQANHLRANSLMILPQVHLRKPCYDFYFL